MSRDAQLFQLDPIMCRTLLRTQHVGRLATTGADPRLVPINYVVADEWVVFDTASDADAVARVGEAVLFEVDMFDERTRSGWSVVVCGRLQVPPPDLEAAVDTWAPGAGQRRLVISIDALTGRLLRGAVEAPADRPAGYL